MRLPRHTHQVKGLGRLENAWSFAALCLSQYSMLLLPTPTWALSECHAAGAGLQMLEAVKAMRWVQEHVFK